MLWWVRPLLVRLLVMLNAIQITQERFHLDNNNNVDETDATAADEADAADADAADADEADAATRLS